MENIGNPQNPFRLAQKLKDCQLEKEALEKQLKEVKAELQSAETLVAGQEEKLKELTTQLERQTFHTQSLHRQMEDLNDNVLQDKSRQQNEVRELNDLLGQERARHFQEHGMRLQLSQELEKTKEQLARQKSLKEMFINKEKETRKELERLKTFSSTDTLEAVRIATEVGNNIKKQQKKVLQRHFEELRVAHMTSQRNFSFVLQAEKEKNKALLQELEQVKVSCQMNLRYETELKAEREKSNSLQKQLDREIQSQAERASEMLEVTEKLRAEKVAVLQQMEEEIQTLKKRASEKEESFFKELGILKEKLKDQSSSNQELVAKLQAEEELSQSLRSELAKLKEGMENKTREQENEATSTIHQMLSFWRGLKGKA